MNPIEQEIQAKGLAAPQLTTADIDAELASKRHFATQEG